MAQDKMTIERLQGMSDEELAEAFGFKEKLAQAREGIAQLGSLKGKARKEAEDRISRMFEPNVYPDEFKWIAEDAKRSVKRSADDELADDGPGSVI